MDIFSVIMKSTTAPAMFVLMGAAGVIVGLHRNPKRSGYLNIRR